jgi:RNA polymerase sigma factor (sigma-70 family)
MMTEKQQNIMLAMQNYGKRLFHFIRRNVSTEEDAEDIIQDVWFSLSTIIDTEPIEKLSAWLFRVSRNRIIDKKRKQNTLSLEDFTYENDDGEIVFPEELMTDIRSESDFEKEFVKESINKALEELPEKQREVFIRNEIDDLTLQEIADLTGENIKTIISRKHYAVLQLRKSLQSLYNELKNE